MSAVHEEQPIRGLLMMLLGEEGRRKVENRTKTNDQLTERLCKISYYLVHRFGGKKPIKRLK
jgi:hypothetical protein